VFCPVCGARNEQGALACESCGALLKEGDSPRAAPAAATPQPEKWVMEGPSCIEHPGTPLVGNCPRCGKQVCVRCAPDAVKDNFTCTECHGLSPAHKLAPLGAVCGTHPDQRAVFVCSRCGTFACVKCKPVYDSSGKCVRCAGSVGAMASRGDRFVAAFVDNLITWLPAIIGVVIGALVLGATGGGKPRDELALVGVFGGMFLGLVLGCGVQLWAQLTWGQTVGKHLTGIKVVRKDGSPVELWRLIIMRNVVVGVLSQACGLLPLVDALMIFTQDQRCLHDYLADTIVVDVQPGI
jgi:uncharacterized RDD family membrane protein YckC